MSWPIQIPVFSNDGLTKELYGFEVQGLYLCYTSYFKYERDTRDDVWPNKWPEPLGLDEWCSLNGMDGWEPRYEREIPDAYRTYMNSLNPCCNKTKDGRVMGGGQSGFRLAEDRPLPSGIGLRAKRSLFRKIKVEGLDEF